MKPRLLDLFCGAGGAAKGYQRAGFHVTGVDVKPQPRYCGDVFIQGDAVAYLRQRGSEFDAIHASPPCQKFSSLRALGVARNGSYPDHIDLVSETREGLKKAQRPYVIENVEGSPLVNPILLCGKMFGLKVYRHRRFESSVSLIPKEHGPHRDKTPAAGMGISPKGFISVCGTGGVKGMNANEILRYQSLAMGIDWMTRYELSQAIPPAYTEYIGLQLIEQLRRTA